MIDNTTSAAASKSPAPSPITDSGPSAFSQCDDAGCANDRLMILVDAITEMLRSACDDMPQGDAKDRALYDVFCLLLLLHDNMKVHGDAINRIQSSIVAERESV